MDVTVEQKKWIPLESGVSHIGVTRSLYDIKYGEGHWKVMGDTVYVDVSHAPVRKFPYDFPGFQHKTEIELLGSFSKARLINECILLDHLYPEQWEFISFPFGEFDYFVAARGMSLYQEPQHSKSSKQGSRALYYGIHKGASRSYLLQYLPVHSPTSSHYHNGIQESFYVFEGSTLIFISGRTNTALPLTQIDVTPKAVHSLLTEEFPCLTLIVMNGSTQGLSSDDHHYKDIDF